MRSLEHGRFFGVTARLLPQLVHQSRVEGPVGETVRAMTKRVGGPAYAGNQSVYGALARLVDGEPSRVLWVLVAGPLAVGFDRAGYEVAEGDTATGVIRLNRLADTDVTVEWASQPGSVRSRYAV